MNCIDLHTHTKYSDGTDDVIEYLKKAEEKKLKIISITDHNTCNAYNALKEIDIKKYFSGKIITGVELNTIVLDVPIEVLGYGIDFDKMNNILPNIYPSREEGDLIEVTRLYEKCKKEGIDLPNNFVEDYKPGMYASQYLHKILKMNEKNKNIIDEESWENSNIFYRKYMSNSKTKFYVNTNDILPDFETTKKIVKECGGLFFLPHIFEYRDNSIKVLEFILKHYEIDGIECYYTTFSKEQQMYLISLCDEKKLFKSGGSDYHGEFKPDVDIGSGYGNLSIPEDIVNEWIEKIKYFC